MKGCKTFGALFLLSMLAWTVGIAAEEDTTEGRVILKISANDPDGGKLSFTWVQKEGRPVKIADPSAARFDKAANKWVSETYFIPTEPDKYVFEVTVRNEYNLETTKRFTQEVLPSTPLPAANPGPDQKARVGQKIVLNGQDSKAFGNRTITKYQWTIVGAPEGFLLTPEQLSARQFDFVAKEAATYAFTLKCFDGKRWGDPVSVEVKVKKGEIFFGDEPTNGQSEIQNGNRPPVKPVTKDPKPVAEVPGSEKPFRIGDIITLDGSRSAVNEADTPRFAWKQIDTEKSPRVRTLTAGKTRPFSAERTDKLNFPVQNFVSTENGSYKFVLIIETNAGVFESEPVTFQVGTGTATPTDPIVPPPPVKSGPTARLIANKTSVSVGEEVTLDGSKSSSEDGLKLTYIWAPVPGKKFPDNIRGTDGPVARFSAQQEGEYSVMLLVNDGRKQGISDPITIRVSAADKPPVIELDATQKCNVGEPLAMEAKIRDPQNLPIKILWTCLEPKSLKIPVEYAQDARFRFTPNKPGTYLFQVEATNSKGLSAVAQTQIGVKDPAVLKPTAVITGQERATVGERVSLSGAKSFSPTQKALSYRWTDESEKIKEPPPNGRKQDWTFKVTEAGRHVISLVVNDGVSDSDPQKFALDVAAPEVVAPPVPPTPPTPPKKNKPVAKITGLKSVALKSEVELSAEGSTSPNDGPLQYYWTDEAAELGLTAKQRQSKVLRFIPMKPGSYTMQLVVVDQNNQSSDTETFTFEVKGTAAVAGPVAVATLLSKDPSPAGKEVRMSAQRSSDPGGAQLTYRWRQTSGPQKLVFVPREIAQEVTVIPSKPGTYEVQVVVNNGDVDSAPATVAFTITGASLPQAIIAEIAPPTVGDTITLDGSGSKSPNGAAGDQLQYFWRQKGGESVRLKVGEDRKSKIQFPVPAEGAYVWELVVNDGNDDSEPAQITFQARARSKNVPPVAVVERPVISTEVGTQTVIDASASNDPDKGPEALTFRWRRGNTELKQSGPIMTFTPATPGTVRFEVVAFDGKDYSEPLQIIVNVAAPGTIPVAIPTVKPNPAPVANRNKPPNPANPTEGVIILDGSGSKAAGGKDMTFTWRQVGGDNLKLPAAALAKDRVGIKIYKAGDYKFELIVSDGENNSAPATIELKVIDVESADK